jgi:TPR repeat/Glycosyltransferase family 9 (heptosyltransferase)
MAKITWRPEQILEMAVSALKAGDFERSAQLCVNAIRNKPEFAEAFHIRGICLLRLQRAFDALLCFDRSLNIKEDQSDCWNNRGIAMAEVGLYDAARASFQQSLSLAPSVEPHVMCGGMFAHLMKLEEAVAEFRAALQIDPQLQDAHLKLGVLLLALGQWEEGWKEYEWRWFDNPLPTRAYRAFPKWRRQDLEGKTILLYSEQGFGDEIMSLRFINDLHNYCVMEYEAQPPRIILEVRPSMFRLARESFPFATVIASGDTYPSEIDYSIPLLDIPMELDIDKPELLSSKKYLQVPSSLTAQWYDRLGGTDIVQVGLCWSSGRRPLQPETEKSAAAKSIPPQLLQSLMQVEGVEFISLQIPREPLPSWMKIRDVTDQIDDFADTAALIKTLDLIITVDTSVAHLAGALGKPVWNLVRFNGYWPWLTPTTGHGMSSGEPTPWYSSMRLFRQPELGYWDPAIADVRELLLTLVRAKAA